MAILPYTPKGSKYSHGLATSFCLPPLRPRRGSRSRAETCSMTWHPDGAQGNPEGFPMGPYGHWSKFTVPQNRKYVQRDAYHNVKNNIETRAIAI